MTKHCFFLLLLMVPSFAFAQDKDKPSPEPLDGPKAIFHDALLDNLQGRWKVTGTIMRKPRELELTAEWVLNHQFLQVRQRDTKTLEGKPVYEVLIFIGYDNASDRYVLHWIDIYGGRFSETLGYGHREGNSIKFNFEYPDGPFHNTFTWNPEGKSWSFLLEQKDAAGKWKNFADQTATRMQ
jgi:hypothetical protein